MSVRAVSFVLHESRSTGNDRLVLIVIADEADNDGLEAFPSIDRISRLARVPKRTVHRCLERLEAGGDLIIRRPDHPGRGRFNRYSLTLGADPTALAGRLGWPPPRLDPDVAAQWETAAQGCQNDTHGIRPQPGDKPGDDDPGKARIGAIPNAFGNQTTPTGAQDPKTQIDTRTVPRRRGLDPRPPDPTERTAAAARAREAEGRAHVIAERAAGRYVTGADLDEVLGDARAQLAAARSAARIVAGDGSGDGSGIPTPNEDDFAGPPVICPAHTLPEPCPTCAAYIAGGL